MEILSGGHKFLTKDLFSDYFTLFWYTKDGEKDDITNESAADKYNHCFVTLMQARVFS